MPPKNLIAKKIKNDSAKILADVAKNTGIPITSQMIQATESEERRQIFLKFFNKYGGNIAAACSATGITRKTFNTWCSKYHEFKEVITDIDDAMIDIAEAQLMKNITAGKETSLIFFLCNKGRGRGWQHVQKIAHQPIKALNIRITQVAASKELPAQKHVEATIVSTETSDVKPAEQ
ncbi:MAG: hypothetical protein KAS32_11610 [Candidatus Peribacteraceae bacterium]|nr:hypothetical protein [Candidatus Peribacteraceae bacterium]